MKEKFKDIHTQLNASMCANLCVCTQIVLREQTKRKIEGYSGLYQPLILQARSLALARPHPADLAAIECRTYQTITK